MTIAVFFLLFEPFLLVPYSVIAYQQANDIHLSRVLLDINLATIAIIIVVNTVQSKFGVFQSPLYSIASPLSGAIVSLSFISSILDAKKVGAVSWRDRKYTVNEDQHPLK